MALRILIATTPVGPIGSGVGGGVDLTLHGIANGLVRRGHHVTVIAPTGSLAVGPGVELVTVAGVPQIPSQSQARDTPVEIPPDSVLAAMWQEVRRRSGDADVVLNLAYDWLPLYLTAFLPVPVAHLVSMASVNDAMDEAIAAIASSFPGTVAVHTHAQAATFAVEGADLRVIGNGLDVTHYEPGYDPEPVLAWVGRVAPEKGLVDAVAVAARTGLPLRVWGLVEHEDTWKEALEEHPDAVVSYEGFVPTADLQAGLRRCLALLATPKWVEAFGNVVAEAMACGVPVIAYRRGGPAELVDEGVTGLVVPPDDVEAMTDAVARVSTLDRHQCRRVAEQRFALDALAERMETWLHDVVGAGGGVRGPITER